MPPVDWSNDPESKEVEKKLPVDPMRSNLTPVRSSGDLGAYQHLIRAFRGLPASSVFGHVKPREKPLSDVLGRCMDSIGLKQPRIEERIIAHWREIVGPDLAHRCSPREIMRQDTLVITTTNPVLRSELAFRKADILQRVRKCLGEESPIKAVVIR